MQIMYKKDLKERLKNSIKRTEIKDSFSNLFIILTLNSTVCRQEYSQATVCRQEY